MKNNHKILIIFLSGVRQPYEIQVYDDFAIKGNTGVSTFATQKLSFIIKLIIIIIIIIT